MAGPEGIQRREEISRVKAEHEEALLKLPNVTGAYTDYKTTGGQRTDTLSIVVTVRSKKDVPKGQAVPKEINGIPTDVIEEEIMPMVGVLLDDIAPAVDAASYATLEGGISIGPCRSVHLDPPEVTTSGEYVFVGTLGCIVRDNVTNEPMMLSNFHVMCINDAWAVGNTMAQPSRVDGGSCPADVVGTLARAQINASVDCAVSGISGRPTACSIVDIGDVAGTATATVGQAVRKRGRTTSLTHGSVTATDYTTSVDYGDGIGVVTLQNQIRIVNDAAQSAQFGIKGDSGSVVVNPSNEVVGLYFAGNSTGTVGVANPITAVLTALNVSMCTNDVKKLEAKEFAKDFAKEWAREKDYLKREIKELEKVRLKERIKEWKEYAYEKFGMDESFDPWERIPPEVFQPPVGRPPVLGGPGTIGRRSLEERVTRLEMSQGVRTAADELPMWEPTIDGGCIDFQVSDRGPGPNPVGAGPYSILVLDHMGAPMPTSAVTTFGAYTGLNAGFTLEAKIGGRCPIVQATLVHYAHPAVMEAYNDDGTLAGTSTMSPAQGVAQTLTIQGTAIAFVRIHSPADETLLLSLCCCAELVCRPDKPDKESKDTKEGKEFKDWKELPRETKELREVGGVSPRMPTASLEGRVAYLESALGGAQHFIPPGARPDLSRGALRYEPGAGQSPARLRHRA